ncbi:hypothetical protein LuPra_02389 [Luteitalea pratensis]|uniref:Uncharacterized protein n=1 Tax=Luteitalea pratensis TaxID=1855912 RepID=A0A143PL93_LUTPR|nr:hypothetical protein LuPra_02389 [Luteitalea pratensis]
MGVQKIDVTIDPAEETIHLGPLTVRPHPGAVTAHV